MGGDMNRNFVVNHLWPIALGALCALPEVAGGKPAWWLAAGAGGCWGVWRLGAARVSRTGQIGEERGPNG